MSITSSEKRISNWDLVRDDFGEFFFGFCICLTSIVLSLVFHLIFPESNIPWGVFWFCVLGMIAFAWGMIAFALGVAAYLLLISWDALLFGLHRVRVWLPQLRILAFVSSGTLRTRRATEKRRVGRTERLVAEFRNRTSKSSREKKKPWRSEWRQAVNRKTPQAKRVETVDCDCCGSAYKVMPELCLLCDDKLVSVCPNCGLVTTYSVSRTCNGEKRTVAHPIVDAPRQSFNEEAWEATWARWTDST